MQQNKLRGKFWGIKNKVTLAILAFLLVPIVIIVAISLGNLYGLGMNVSQIGGQALQSEQYRSLTEISTTKSQFIDQVFQGVASDVESVENYTHNIFEQEINVTSRQSYYHNDTTLPIPGLYWDTGEYKTPTGGRWISRDVSGYVLPWAALAGKTDYHQQNVSMNATISRSAHLDVLFRSLKETTPDYAWIYVGFDIGLHRSYPWHAYTGDFDPRSRPWYQQAVQSYDSVAFTSPYMDASGRGLMISVAKAVHWHNGSLIGVAAADLTIDTIRQSILNTKILSSGYAFLIDGAGNTVTHPKLSTINTPITSFEGNDHNFTTIRSAMIHGQSGIGAYLKNGTPWVISYAPIPHSGFSFAVVVPAAEITAPADQIQSDIMELIGVEFVIMLAILVGVVIVIGITGNYVSKRIVRPVTDLTKMVNFIAQGDISREIPFIKERNPDEVTILQAGFQNLVTLLRLGNVDYYRGDLNLAFTNYTHALEIFKVVGNRQGMAVCYNNLANIHRLRGESGKAEEDYKKAIEIGNSLNDIQNLIGRYNNLAQLYADTARPDHANETFNLALSIQKDQKLTKAMAQTYRNIGLFAAREGIDQDSHALIRKAIEIDERLHSDQGMAFNYFYLGLLASLEKSFPNAESELKTALDFSEKCNDKRLTSNILKELESVYIGLRQPAKAQAIRIRYERLRKEMMLRKAVVFVIDISGSMRGQRIAAAIKGALDIFENQINPQDLIAVVTFHSESTISLPTMQKSVDERRIRQVISNIDATPYQTALYDAIGDSFEILNDVPGNAHKWIIALTDGLDNKSLSFSLKDRKHVGWTNFLNADRRVGLGEYIRDNLLNVNLALIALDREIQPMEAALRDLCNRFEGGRYIPVYDLSNATVAIRDAFKKVSELLAQVTVEEFVTEGGKIL